MDKVYRINVMACYKPWRYSTTYLLTSSNDFHKVKTLVENEGNFLPMLSIESFYDDVEVEFEEYDDSEEEPVFEVEQEPESLEDFLSEISNNEVEMPYVLIDELTLYTE